MASLSHSAHALWYLGYPAQSLQKGEQGLVRGQESAHPFSLAYGQTGLTFVHVLRHEEHLAQRLAETTISFAEEQGFPFWEILAMMVRGWALTKQGQEEEGIEQIRQSLHAWQAAGAKSMRPQVLAWLAEAYAHVGQPEEGLIVLAEGLATVERTGERFYEAEMWRLKGELTLQQWKVESQRVESEKSKVPSPKS